MKARLLFLLLVLAVRFASAQTPGPVIFLKDGQTIKPISLRRAGANVMVTVPVAAGRAEIGYPVANLDRIEFPEPAGLKSAPVLLAQDKPAEALAAIEPVVREFDALRDIPGSPWSRAAVLKLNALVALGREAEAAPLVTQLASVPDNAEAARQVRVQQAVAAVRKGEYKKALELYDTVIGESADHATLAQAWINKGRCLLALREWEDAGLAFVRIPALYPDQKLLFPPALLGTASAFAGLREFDEARRRFQEIVDTYPDSPEAAAARTELEKLSKKSI